MPAPPTPSRRSGRRRAAALLGSAALALLPGSAGAEPGERAILLAQAEPAPEQETGSSAGPPPGVEVMRVRGRGIAAIETEVPSSITQFDAATIEALGAQDISDLSRVTPNVNIVQPGATQAIFFIRGVGLSDFSSNAAGAVTIFQDDVSLNAPAIQTGQLFDIEGVDVVRGPQGSGPFRNASAGAIRVRSRRPTGNYTAQLRSSLGRYAADGGKGAHHGRIQDYEGALEVPIVDDLLSSRFAFRFRDAEPFMSNGCGHAPAFEDRIPLRGLTARLRNFEEASVCGERNFRAREVSPIPVGLPLRVGDQYNWAARGSLALRPQGSETALFLNFHGSRLAQDATLGQAMGTLSLQGVGNQLTLGGPTGGEGVVPFSYQEPDQAEEFERLCAITSGVTCQFPDLVHRTFEANLAEKRPLDIRPFRGDYNRVGEESRDTWGAFASAEMELGEYDLFLLGSYDQYEREVEQDTDFTPELLFESPGQFDGAWQTYEEVRLGGELAATPFEWELGGYYLQESLRFRTNNVLANDSSFVRNYSQRISSFGTWGEFEWDFLDDFTLQGGVRFNWEKKEFRFTRQMIILQTSLLPETTEQDETWQVPTGEIVLTYHIDERAQAYARYTRGFKAGHFNALSSEQILQPPAEEELNDAWEAGLRGAWFDGRLSGATSFFYYRYTNYQVFLFRDVPGTPPALEILNAEEAENFGIEVEGRVEPLRGWVPRVIEGLLLSGTFGWLHGEYIDFQITNSARSGGINIPFTVDFSGKRLQNAPEFKVSATAEWTLDLGRWGFLVPRYDMSWEDDKFFDPNEGRGTPFFASLQPQPEYAVGQAAYFLHNVRLAYRTPTGNIEVAGWVRNLEDQVYKTFAFDATSFSGVLINFVGEPRTIGVDLTVTF